MKRTISALCLAALFGLLLLAPAESGADKQLTASNADEQELKLIALSSLINAKPDRALPMLKKVLASDSSSELKTQALFILAQTDSPQAAEIVRQHALGQDPELQMIAVHHLGLGGNKNLATLREIYETATDNDVKTAVLHSYMIADATDELLAAAQTENDPELRQMAIIQLGQTAAGDELWTMYGNETDSEIKTAILHGLFLSDDVERIGELARNEPDEDLRMAAIHHLGLLDSSDALAELFRNESSPELRQAILHGLALAGDTTILTEVARNDGDPDMRTMAIHQIGVFGGDEARDTLRSLLDQESDPEIRETLLHSLFLSDDVETLLEVARTESSPEIRRAAVHHLSLMDSEEALAYLESLLDIGEVQ